MKQALPSVESIKTSLSGLNHAQLNDLAAVCGVPFPTLMKIRQGSTLNPRLGTVAKILGALPCGKRKGAH